MNDEAAFDNVLDNNVAAVIIEGIQGVGGIQVPDDSFLKHLEKKCQHNGSLLILDEIQCGYGRTGKFFAHQHAGIEPHLITTAKGMGNGFPIGGLFIHPDIKPWSGMLGTTFGGNYLASVAGLAVLEVMEKEDLMVNTKKIGAYWLNELGKISRITEVRGRGLMIGIDLPEELKQVRNNLLFNHHIFTGESKPNTIRLLPSLAMTMEEADLFLTALKQELK
jgi:acetylornithine aminotransferase